MTCCQQQQNYKFPPRSRCERWGDAVRYETQRIPLTMMCDVQQPREMEKCEDDQKSASLLSFLFFDDRGNSTAFSNFAHLSPPCRGFSYQIAANGICKKKGGNSNGRGVVRTQLRQTNSQHHPPHITSILRLSTLLWPSPTFAKNHQ